MFDNVRDAMDYVMSKRRGDSSFLDFKNNCKLLGNPQNGFYEIHVTGTNGKGSTVAYLRDLLMSQGYRVGTLQSPHYLTHLDRIRVNGENIKEEAFVRLLNKHLDMFEENDMGMFEMDYIIMCDYFREEKIDIAIVEVGLGGRLDSTNVVDDTKLSIITTIGYDHMDRLGNSLEEICIEKCGIIKENSKVLVGHIDETLKRIVKGFCRTRNCDYYELEDYTDLGNRSFKYEDDEYSINSFAKYQLHNACLALKAFKIISDDYKFDIDWNKAKEALNASKWAGRFDIVKDNPRVILDGGHNIHGINELVKSFDIFEGSKAIVFSALERKEYTKMFEVLAKHTNKLIITVFNGHEKLMNIDNLKADNCVFIKDTKEAIDYAINNYENILICGSLYFISDVVENYKF